MISIERGLNHAAWADDKLFSAVAQMPADALKATYAKDEWHVARHGKFGLVSDSRAVKLLPHGCGMEGESHRFMCTAASA